MVDTFALNRADIKSAFIAIAIAGGGGLYWYFRQKTDSASPNRYKAGLNNSSASRGAAGAIAPSSTINTYNVFPTISSQMSTANSFFNGPHSINSPSSLNSNNRIWLSNGQSFSLPIQT